ncbi:GtrA family protein [Clostridium sp. AM42-36]|jgi:putative flippase GtrA|nr:GtrA family protein [Clostridium sp. AM42-36]
MLKILFKYKQFLLYALFGGLTFVVSVMSYGFFCTLLAFNELFSNLLSWILAVSFAFFTNRIWVFQSPTNTSREFFHQLLKFFSSRLATLGVEEIILLLFVTIMHLPNMLVKIAAQIIVIILNYILSKKVIFTSKAKTND